MAEWMPVTGYEGRYEVSSEGAVRKVSGKEIGQFKHSDGYLLVRLSGPRAILRVHRIVATAFIPNPLSLHFVNHIDCQRANNRRENLEWCTQKQNIEHADRLGRMQRNYWKGRRSPSAAISDEVAAAIRADYTTGKFSHRELGEKYGLSKRSVGRIIN